MYIGKPKVKLYRDVDGDLKGDALCCYLKVKQHSLFFFVVLIAYTVMQVESLPLALSILDGSTLRNHTISVEKVFLLLVSQCFNRNHRNKPNRLSLCRRESTNPARRRRNQRRREASKSSELMGAAVIS